MKAASQAVSRGSKEQLKELHKRLIDVELTREEIASALDLYSEVVRWAFERGQSPRAREVRRIVLRHLEKLEREQARARAKESELMTA